MYINTKEKTDKVNKFKRDTNHRNIFFCTATTINGRKKLQFILQWAFLTVGRRVVIMFVQNMCMYELRMRLCISIPLSHESMLKVKKMINVFMQKRCVWKRVRDKTKKEIMIMTMTPLKRRGLVQFS